MPITHAKVATLPDDASSEVKASDWNDDHVGGGSDDQTAAEVPFTPAGGIAATDVQAAIEELDTEKAALASAVMDGDAAGGDLSGTYPNPSVANDSHSHGPGTAPGAGGTQDIEEVLTEGGDPNGQPFTGAVIIRPDGTDLYGILIEAQAGFEAAYNAYIRMFAENGEQFYNIDVGGLDVIAPTGQGQSHVLFQERDTAATGQVSSRGFTFADGDAQVAFSSGVGLRFRAFTPSEVPDNHYVQISYDDTDAAAYLQLVGKTADGTAVTGRVRLGATVQTYTESNVTTDRAFNANSTTLDELADVLGTLIGDLRAQGVVA